uniref:Uncharacterized protein n=1 Tax=Micrurus paraensis TaxID=1970185 RepID=A0A2D4KMP4_9SAUR
MHSSTIMMHSLTCNWPFEGNHNADAVKVCRQQFPLSPTPALKDLWRGEDGREQHEGRLPQQASILTTHNWKQGFIFEKGQPLSCRTREHYSPVASSCSPEICVLTKTS